MMPFYFGIDPTYILVIIGIAILVRPPHMLTVPFVNMIKYEAVNMLQARRQHNIFYKKNRLMMLEFSKLLVI